MGILLSGIMGIILGEGFWGGILYIGVPMTSGGMTAGTVPLSAMYSQALGVEAADVLTKMAPATVLGNCVAIIFGGLLNNFGKKHPETTGNGVLVNDGKTVKKTPPLKPTFASLCTGMIIAFAFYQLGAILHRFVPVIPTYAWMIIAVVLVKGSGKDIVVKMNRSICRSDFNGMTVQILIPAVGSADHENLICHIRCRRIGNGIQRIDSIIGLSIVSESHFLKRSGGAPLAVDVIFFCSIQTEQVEVVVDRSGNGITIC